MQKYNERSKITWDIDSFKNKQQMGLFTFYIETQNPNSAISFSQENRPKYSNDSKTIDNNDFETKKISQYRINSKPGRKLRTLQSCANSIYDHQMQDQLIGNSDRNPYYSGQFIQVKELFNFKREKSKMILQELLMKNEVDNEILQRFSHKKSIINPERFPRQKKHNNMRGFPKLSGHVKSGYLSNAVKKISKQSLQKQQRIKKNFSQQVMSPKQKLGIDEMRQITQKLDMGLKLQQHRLQTHLFPFNKIRNSSHLKDMRESQSNQVHPNSNDRMIYKLKNTKKILQTGQKGHNQIPLDNISSLRESQDNHTAIASQTKPMNQIITSSMTKLQINNAPKQNSLESQIDSFYFPQEKLGCLKKNSKSIQEQRNRNHSEIQSRNQLPLVYNISTLERIYRPRLNSIANPQQMNRKQQNRSNVEKKKQNSNKELQTKKNLLMIVKKVKNQYLSI